MTILKTELGEFKSKAAYKRAIRPILYDGEVMQPIIYELHKKAVSELFYCREDKVAKLEGRAVVDWIKLNGMNGNRCFAALFEDGSHLHFSYPKGVDILAAASQQ